MTTPDNTLTTKAVAERIGLTLERCACSYAHRLTTKPWDRAAATRSPRRTSRRSGEVR
jgi:hypothetical protein